MQKIYKKNIRMLNILSKLAIFLKLVAFFTKKIKINI